ncbi:hypothetical protein H7J08_05515 [Mycobacterium frederiksbergense]|uniref:hypothetical protein n=1 Tax=Mycolicibacterium frederiksbergense TaxID=117567 RepID=UPI0021F2B157|nr:hypothetical protein [Mycolicibacterium frederiksbergense]MCV7044130.1 hypothetical protein [Mycolicibacterium frederiksbergense]
MTTPLAYLALGAVLLAPFALTWALSRTARRTGILRLSLDQFRPAAPFVGRLAGSGHPDDRDGLRAMHDLDAIRTRFEAQPSWPTSSASGERR